MNPSDPIKQVIIDFKIRLLLIYTRLLENPIYGKNLIPMCGATF